MNSLDHSINLLVKQYSSLFTLPALRRILLYLFTLLFLGSTSSCLTFEFSISNLLFGAGFALLFFSIIVLLDFIISKSLMKGDAVFNFRRCLALSLFSTLMWLILVLMGNFLSLYFRSEIIWVKFFLLGFCVSIISRLIVFLTVSMKNSLSASFSAILQPLICLFLTLIVWQAFGMPISLSLAIFLAVAIPIVFLTAYLFILIIDVVGRDSPLRISAFSLFKAFMANWTENLNDPLERIFERLGEEREVQVSLLAFRGRNGYKAVLVVPSFHPGPFKNVGSSPIPYLIQRAVSEKLNCPVAVPHGLFGHELDLTSQRECEKVLSAILDSLSFKSFTSEASPIIRVSRENASATCQLFGKCAFLTLTLAPETTEDFPKEIGEHISKSAVKHGISNVIVVNSHNSINSLEQQEGKFALLKLAASESLKEALKIKSRPLRIGAAKLNPKEYGIREGMGPGGIVALAFEINGQIYAYVVFDGNNMISGLREKILKSLRDLGIVEGEVMTSDTHVVNGVVLNRRGYHPIGEVMEHQRVIELVEEVVSEAIRNMEPVSVSYQTVRIPSVKVIGTRQIEAMGLIAHRAAKRAKRAAITIFPIIGLVLVSLLLAI